MGGEKKFKKNIIKLLSQKQIKAKQRKEANVTEMPRKRVMRRLSLFKGQRTFRDTPTHRAFQIFHKLTS